MSAAAGFVFHNDMHHLVHSFPHLPAFHPLPLRVRQPSFGAVHPAGSSPISYARVAKALMAADPDRAPAEPSLAAEDAPCGHNSEAVRHSNAGGHSAAGGHSDEGWRSEDNQPTASASAETQQPQALSEAAELPEAPRDEDRAPAHAAVLLQTQPQVASSIDSAAVGDTITAVGDNLTAVGDNILEAGGAASGTHIGAFQLHSFVDLHYMLSMCRPDLRWRLQRASLKKMVEKLLGQQLNKAQQTSAWAARPLTAPQLEYAANDAHVLVVMYNMLARTSIRTISAQEFDSWRGGDELLKVLYGRQESCVFQDAIGQEAWQAWRNRLDQ